MEKVLHLKVAASKTLKSPTFPPNFREKIEINRGRWSM